MSISKKMDVPELKTTMHREKEALVTMFLANASHIELALQYSIINELHSKITETSKRNQREDRSC